MADPVLAAVLGAVVAPSFLVGLYTGCGEATSNGPPPDEAESAGAVVDDPPSVFRRGVGAAVRPAVVVWIPLALLGTVVVLVIGRAGGPPPDVVILGEILGILSLLALIVGCATATGSVLAMTVRTRSAS